MGRQNRTNTRRFYDLDTDKNISPNESGQELFQKSTRISPINSKVMEQNDVSKDRRDKINVSTKRLDSLHYFNDVTLVTNISTAIQVLTQRDEPTKGNDHKTTHPSPNKTNDNQRTTHMLLGCLESLSELHQCYIAMDVMNFDYFGKIYEWNYETFPMKVHNFTQLYPHFFIIPLTNYDRIDHMSHIHRNVTLMKVRSTFPTTDAITFTPK